MCWPCPGILSRQFFFPLHRHVSTKSVNLDAILKNQKDVMEVDPQKTFSTLCAVSPFPRPPVLFFLTGEEKTSSDENVMNQTRRIKWHQFGNNNLRKGKKNRWAFFFLDFLCNKEKVLERIEQVALILILMSVIQLLDRLVAFKVSIFQTTKSNYWIPLFLLSLCYESVLKETSYLSDLNHLKIIAYYFLIRNLLDMITCL